MEESFSGEPNAKRTRWDDPFFAESVKVTLPQHASFLQHSKKGKPRRILAFITTHGVLLYNKGLFPLPLSLASTQVTAASLNYCEVYKGKKTEEFHRSTKNIDPSVCFTLVLSQQLGGTKTKSFLSLEAESPEGRNSFVEAILVARNNSADMAAAAEQWGQFSSQYLRARIAETFAEVTTLQKTFSEAMKAYDDEERALSKKLSPFVVERDDVVEQIDMLRKGRREEHGNVRRRQEKLRAKLDRMNHVEKRMSITFEMEQLELKELSSATPLLTPSAVKTGDLGTDVRSSACFQDASAVLHRLLHRTTGGTSPETKRLQKDVEQTLGRIEQCLEISTLRNAGFSRFLEASREAALEQRNAVSNVRSCISKEKASMQALNKRLERIEDEYRGLNTRLRSGNEV